MVAAAGPGRGGRAPAMAAGGGGERGRRWRRRQGRVSPEVVVPCLGWASCRATRLQVACSSLGVRASELGKMSCRVFPFQLRTAAQGGERAEIPNPTCARSSSDHYMFGWSSKNFGRIEF